VSEVHDTLVISSRGEIVARERLEEYQVIVSGALLPDSDLALAFESLDSFNRWASGAKTANSFAAIHHVISESQRYQEEDHSEVQEVQRRHVEHANEALRERANRLSMDPGSHDFISRMTVDRPPLAPPICDSAWLWADPGFSGPWLYIPPLLPLPDFTWFGWNDQPSSGVVTPPVPGFAFDVLLVCQHTWWRGRRLFLFSFRGTPRFFNLSTFAFDNTVSSALLLSLVM
jgi:hypothetical protein